MRVTLNPKPRKLRKGHLGQEQQICGELRDNGKENGHHYSTLGLYRDNGKENGNYYSTLRLSRDNGEEHGS